MPDFADTAAISSLKSSSGFLEFLTLTTYKSEPKALQVSKAFSKAIFEAPELS